MGLSSGLPGLPTNIRITKSGQQSGRVQVGRRGPQGFDQHDFDETRQHNFCFLIWHKLVRAADIAAIDVRLQILAVLALFK